MSLIASPAVSTRTFIVVALVAAMAVAPAAQAALLSQGAVRVGADALWSRGDLGQGQTVAIVDKGFAGLDRSIALGELPPRADMTIQLFDPAGTLDGADEFGLPSPHGVRMAEIIHDIAPDAHLVLVGYRTLAQFEQAAAWVAAQGIPVATHSNSFFTPPFDGTGAAARAVNAAAAAGVLWVNSAGNFAQRHWRGVAPAGGAIIPIAPAAGDPLLFSLAWGPPAVSASLSVERQDATGAWVEVQHSTTASPINALTDPLITDGGAYRVVVRQDAGPPAELDLFSRTIGFGALAVADGSIPTPGDAAGAVTVGAVKWTGTTIEPYSSQGRAGQGKPDLVGPTYITSNPEWPGTAGTSASTPHVAGIAILMRQARIAAGLPADRATLRNALVASALDLGAPGPDPVFGAGMARADTSAPAVQARVSRRQDPGGAGARPRRRYDPSGVDHFERAEAPRGPEARRGRASAHSAPRSQPSRGDRRRHGRQRRGAHPDPQGPVPLTRRSARLALGIAAGALMAYAGASVAAAAPASLTVSARPGQTAKVSAALARSGLKVQRRQGRQLQVVADPSRARALARIPGVAAARTATASFGDTLAESQGVWRSGADVLGRVAGGGAGLRIAILDLGFGANIPRLQALGEMPPSSRVQSLTFDAASGLAGTNAYGNKTNHGEIVAQTVYDYAPAAQYFFVNYHTEADFLAATDALIALHPDIVVHSNSFIEGPFDGTGPLARAVDRAANSGILWFNSAGNYALLHWEGPWVDADGDDDLDWPNGDNWTFARPAGQPITFGLSWTSPPGGPPTDLDLILERQEADGTWSPAMGSTDRQSAGLPTSERITAYSPFADAVFRLRVVRFSGPPPVGPITLYSREIPMAAIGGTAVSSIPTPGDATGSITVGAVDWRGNALKNYSSQGPTDDGRLKPDISAPTNTQIMGPNGFRGVGGTSNSAPNAAGAAAVLLAAARGAGGNPTAAEVRSQLTGLALDLGAPGPDDAYGWGRVRVSGDAPRLTRQTPVRPRLGAQARDGQVQRDHAVAHHRLMVPHDRRPTRHGATPDVSAGHHHRHPAAHARLAPAQRAGGRRARQRGHLPVVGLRRQHRADARHPHREAGQEEGGQEAGRAADGGRQGPRRRRQADRDRHDQHGRRPQAVEEGDPVRARPPPGGPARAARDRPLPRSPGRCRPRGQSRVAYPSHRGPLIGRNRVVRSRTMVPDPGGFRCRSSSLRRASCATRSQRPTRATWTPWRTRSTPPWPASTPTTRTTAASRAGSRTSRSSRAAASPASSRPRPSSAVALRRPRGDARQRVRPRGA